MCGGCTISGDTRFNPHSPLLANEFWGATGVAALFDVSIHIRHCWRMNSSTNLTRPRRNSFNPHSPLLANELLAPLQPLLTYLVSIHIRHCWRMNCFGQLVATSGQRVSIHIRHCWRMNCTAPGHLDRPLAVSIHIRHCWRMNYVRAIDSTIASAFQSTFAIAGE